jgi:protein tyrosine phosphatase (PTP) superfamily phosphohydrolase (DUF442 family)
MTRPALRKAARITAASLVALTILIGLAVVYRRSTGNLGTVEDGRVYRSAQLSPEALREVIARRGVKTVLNLRGPNPSEAWYRDEVAATLDAGAVQIDVPLASDMWLSREQAQTLLDVLDGCEYPIIIHCEFGAERTGLVAAMVELLRPGRKLADARAQFSIRYLFLPIRDGLVMLGHLDRYEAWLRAAHLDHSPAHFRRWLLAEYQPPWPNSREHWPCNPYPRKVVTTRDASGRRISLPELPEDACPKTVATQIEADHARR